MPAAAATSFIAHFAASEDPRQSWKVLYPLPEILLLVLCATLAGTEDFVEIRRWGRVDQDFLRRFLPYAAGIPSHDTLNDLINAVDGNLFAHCFATWVEGLHEAAPDATSPEVVAIDGKLLAVKDNQPSLHGEVQRLFADPAAAIHSRCETTDGEHGRIEVRRHCVSHSVEWLTTDRRFPGEPRFSGLRAVAMIEAEAERNGRISRERRYHPSSLPLDARLFARAVRCHWHIGNRLHWILDVVFHEDLSRLRSAAGPQNMATVRHMAINLIRSARDTHSLKVRRKSAARDTSYLEAIIRQSP